MQTHMNLLGKFLREHGLVELALEMSPLIGGIGGMVLLNIKQYEQLRLALSTEPFINDGMITMDLKCKISQTVKLDAITVITMYL
jgi:hypothetical protein